MPAICLFTLLAHMRLIIHLKSTNNRPKKYTQSATNLSSAMDLNALLDFLMFENNKKNLLFLYISRPAIA